MASFKNFTPPKCRVLRNGELKEIPAANLVRGDIVNIIAGDRIPADMRIFYSDEMRVDNSSLTGEPDELERTTYHTHESILETNNVAFFGTLCKKGKGKGIVFEIGNNTFMGKIANLAEETENKETTLSIELKHFIYIISGVALFLGVSFFIISMILDPDVIINLTFMIGIIVANVPEGLLATVTVALSLTALKMSNKNVLVKNLESVETLGSTTCICSDKTGTLTKNKMVVKHLF